MDTYGAIVRFFAEGGAFMYPIAVTLALGIAVAIERWLYLSSTAVKNRILWNRITPYLKAGNFKAAIEETQKSNAAIGTILTYGLSRVSVTRDRDEIEKAMEESLMDVIPRLEKRTHYLGTFAYIATLLGLLGTVMGLISAFAAVANVNPAEKANLLSASISEAMNCTAFGLMTAIPLVLVHAFLQSRTTELIDSLEMVSVKFLNALTERWTAQGANLSPSKVA